MNQEFSHSLFGSRAGYEAAFERGLETLLQSGDLNLFILVLANASFEKRLFQRLRPQLLEQYQRLSCELFDLLHSDAGINPANDDLQVFSQIVKIGFGRMNVTEHCGAGPWEIQFNQLRSLRPMRNSQRRISSIREAFLESGFHFNKPFLQQESLWTGQLLGRHVDLYYNKYPFVDSHALLVPERGACMPQFLDQEMHTYISGLVKVLGATVPGLRVGYNAFGAFASVNHLHFQLFIRDAPLPVEALRWQHNGGTDPYPVEGQVFDDAASAWSAIERLHQQNQAYNLLYTADRLYCLPRRKQGDFALPDWSKGFSWYEMCGGMITFERGACRTLTEPAITAALAGARLDDAVDE
ncbi:MAG: hypothetical protein RQ736_01530 [Thiogranum sp.]|nr:hypothetical protein [Thiogranum sp.]